MSALYIILLIAVVSVSLLLLLLVLMQRPRQEGLGATFGVDVTSQMFGSRTTDVLQKGTVYLTVAFFLICIGIGLLNAHDSKQAAQLGKELAEQPAPPPAPGPVTPAEPAPKAETASPPIEVPPSAPAEGKPAETPGSPAAPPSPTAAGDSGPEAQKQLDERTRKYHDLVGKLQEAQKLVGDPAISEELRAQKRKEVDVLASEVRSLASDLGLPIPGETPPAAPGAAPEPPKSSQ